MDSTRLASSPGPKLMVSKIMLGRQVGLGYIVSGHVLLYSNSKLVVKHTVNVRLIL